MSYDPNDAFSDVPPEYDPAAQPPGERERIKGRVQVPAIALIVAGILNVLGVGWGFFNVAMTTLVPANQFHQQMLDIYQSFPQMQAELSKRSPDELKNQSMIVGWGWVGLGLLSTVLTIAGAVRMLALKNYALGICGAISAAIPCISCVGCCGIGEIIGIWALVVLLNAEVRDGFLS
jgi:hypothetical protein